MARGRQTQRIQIKGELGWVRGRRPGAAHTRHPNIALMQPGLREIVIELHPEPRLGRASERLGEANSHLSGEIPLLPLTMLFTAWRVTPSTLAAPVTDSPSGSKQSSRTDSPGCGGFFIGMVFSPFSLVVIDQINIGHVVALEAENDSPVRPHRDAPKSRQITLERVQPEAGQRQVVRFGRTIEASQHALDFLDVLRVEPAPIVIVIEPS